jgi:hypothetical protein
MMYMYFQDHHEEGDRYKQTGKSKFDGSRIVTVQNLDYRSQYDEEGQPKHQRPSYRTTGL